MTLFDGDTKLDDSTRVFHGGRPRAFYQMAFEPHVGAIDADGSCEFYAGENPKGRRYRLVFVEQPISPRPVPVIEWMVDNIARCIALATAAGAIVRHNKAMTYAQIVDPFGYYWALAIADEPDGNDDP